MVKMLTSYHIDADCTILVMLNPSDYAVVAGVPAKLLRMRNEVKV